MAQVWVNSSLLYNQSKSDISQNPSDTLGMGRTQDQTPGSRIHEFWREADQLTITIGYPLVLVCGIIGNTFTLLVLRRMQSDASTLLLFFMALAVSDLAVLFVQPLPLWIEVQFGVHLLTLSQVSCKVFHWFQYAFGMLSAWLLAAMTIERAVSVVWPHKVRSSCTKRQAHVTIAALVLTALLITSNLLSAFEIHPQSAICTFTDSYFASFIDVWLWVNFLLASFLPFSILLVSNTVLIWKVLQAVRTAEQCLAGGQSADQVATREKKLLSMTVTLIAVSAAFILLTGPNVGTFLWEYYHLFADTEKWSDEEFYNTYPYLDFVSSFGSLLVNTNSAINFFLYILTGTRFRHEFRALLGMCLYTRSAETLKSSAKNGKYATGKKSTDLSGVTQSSIIAKEF